VCRPGESLEDVAAAHDVQPQQLARVNGFSGGALREGLVLLLPRALDNVAMAPDVTTYTVVAGDNYSRIARNYHMTTAGLMSLNQAETSALQVGDVLYVPNPTQ
jgi:LysM repeat protein